MFFTLKKAIGCQGWSQFIYSQPDFEIPSLTAFGGQCKNHGYNPLIELKGRGLTSSGVAIAFIP